MFSDLKAYFIENILSLHYEYLEIRKNRKLAFSSDMRSSINLAIALYHFREHFPEKLKKPRRYYVTICPDYSLLGDIVNVAKHSKLTRNNPQISSADNIYEQIVSTEYKDEKGLFYHIEKVVIIKLDNGDEKDLHEIITNTINMWIKELISLEVIESYPIQKYKSNKLPRRNEHSDNFDIQSMNGLRFKANFKLQRYNYEKKVIEPIDLTNSKVKLRIYKQINPVDITITTKDNKIIKITVELSDNELNEYLKLKCHNSQVHYLFEKAKHQGLIDY